ncbi:MAG TPA: hypothetical protein VNG90_03510, partial [Candidatus Acidoferrum sp.]|nr:hypothetical protein [Candidatus Acidoferrum sp.]
MQPKPTFSLLEDGVSQGIRVALVRGNVPFLVTFWLGALIPNEIREVTVEIVDADMQPVVLLFSQSIERMIVADQTTGLGQRLIEALDTIR